ncbi:hypothetical protein FRC06_004442 [Ceratobasidium sp. 370]|nr:hypothetical protein FRC06_004442 [Ceratobasidium sp. 370]
MASSAGYYGTPNSIDTESQVHRGETAKSQLSSTADQARLLDNNREQVSDRSSGGQPYLEPRLGVASNSDVDHELAGLGALEDGRPGERPAYPFTTLIRYAIKGSPKGRLLLEEIYQAIQSRYPFFTTAPAGWKNSVRHTLSLMTCFEKVPRLLTEPGKGSYWTVNDSMPHAKPSRVRVRKRKTRTDDSDSTFGTPLSAPDTFPSEMETASTPINEDYYRAPPFGWTSELYTVRGARNPSDMTATLNIMAAGALTPPNIEHGASEYWSHLRMPLAAHARVPAGVIKLQNWSRTEHSPALSHQKGRHPRTP